jgi:ParB-like chromosome segregation protein Spo0J
MPTAAAFDHSSSQPVTLPIEQITVDPDIQIRRAGTNDAVVADYAENLDRLPPVHVFRLPDGQLLLSDGFHRVAAHERKGRLEIQAFVTGGNRKEALVEAAVANVGHGLRLDADEVADAVRRLHEEYPDWSHKEIARRLRCADDRVNRVLRAGDVRQKVGGKKLERFSDPALSLIAALPREQWKPAIQAAEKLKLNQDGLQIMVKNLLDPELDDGYKHKLLAGEAQPVVKTQDGQLKTPISILKRESRANAVEPDPVGDDVAERLKSVRFRVDAEYQLPSTRTRTRGLMTYSREAEWVPRHWDINLGPEALDYTPRQVVEAVGQKWLRKLTYEGWPSRNA